MRTVAVLFIFLILSGVFTWPLPLNLRTAFDNDADAMMGVCALEWLGRNLWTRPGHLFEASLYFPRPQPLRTGFHTYAVAVLFYPIRLISGSPLAAFNLLHMLTLAMDAFAMYLLVRHLTRSSYAGFIAGVIFGFCPFRTANFQHIPFMTNYWSVFSLLSLFRFFESATSRTGARASHFYAAAVLYLLQCLSDIITGIYFGAVLIPFTVYNLVANRRYLSSRIVTRVILSSCALAACLCALLLPLRSIRHELGAQRVSWNLENVQEISPCLSSYLSAPAGNILYGELTRGFSLNSRQPNFYGLTAYALAVLGIVHLLHMGRSFRGHARQCPGVPPVRIAVFFSVAFITALLLSLGPELYLMPGKRICTGPYMLIYRLIPTMRTLRTLGGLGIVALLSLSVLAGFGIKKMLDILARRGLCRRWILGTALLLIVAAECASYPPTSWGEPFHLVPSTMPAVYQWLMDHQDGAPVIELPMPWEPEEVGGAFGLDTAAMYWSIFHGRRIVNGQTGFYYPEYKIIVDQMKLFPSRETIDILRALGVRYVVMHVGRLPRLEWQKELVRKHPEARYDWRETLKRAEQFSEELVLRKKAGGDRVYEILPRRESSAVERPHLMRPLSRREWRPTASSKAAAAELAIDGDGETAWESWQRAGLSFQLDLGRREEICEIRMLLRSANECPKNPRVEVSDDGMRWTAVEYEGAYLDFVQRLLANSRENLFLIAFPPVRARFVRMTLTRMDNLYPWSIAELEVYGKT